MLSHAEMAPKAPNKRNNLLEEVPPSYLYGIIKNQCTREEISRFLEGPLNLKRVRDPLKRLKKLAPSDLIFMIESLNLLTDMDIQKIYRQFKDSTNPNFYLFKPIFPTTLLAESDKGRFQSAFVNKLLDRTCRFVPESLVDPSDLKYQKFKIIEAISLDNGKIYEFNFEYLKRLSYIDENYVIKTDFGLNWGFIWIDIQDSLVIIRVNDDAIVTAIIENLNVEFQTNFTKFCLPQEIIMQLLNPEELTKRALKLSPGSDNSLFKSMIIKDPRFYEKLRDPKFSFIVEYDTTSSQYFTHVPGLDNKIRVNLHNSGKIALIGQSIKLESCRGWLLGILRNIMSMQETYLKNGDVKNLLHTTDIVLKSELYKKIHNDTARKVIYDIINGISILKSTRDCTETPLNFSLQDALHWFSSLTPIVMATCEDPECNANMICPYTPCDSHHFRAEYCMANHSIEIKCGKCGKIIDNGVEVECLDGHCMKLNYDASIYYGFTMNTIIEFNRIMTLHEISFQIDPITEFLYLHNNRLWLKPTYGKTVYDWTELPIFREYPKLEDLSLDVRTEQASQIPLILEKCKEKKLLCRECPLFNTKEKCMLNIFAKLSSGQAHPHTGCEYGDFEFPQIFQSGKETIVGIAKSSRKGSAKIGDELDSKRFGTLTYMNSDRLFEQVFEMSMNSAVKFIMVVSGRFIDTRLRDYLTYIVRLNHKKIVYIEPKDLIPILAEYNKRY